MNIISIITIDLTSGEKRQHEIDYDLRNSRIWLANHSMWALNNNQCLTTMPRSGLPKIFIGHDTDKEISQASDL